jgi:hypothetical protein
MKLELKYLSGYLPYELQMYWEDFNGVVMDSWTLQADSVTFSLINQNKPILRPLSDLTKEIEVNGEKFVPNYDPHLKYFLDCEFKSFINDIPYSLNYDQLQLLLQWHFDIYGLIDAGLAIDINTL